MSRSRDPSDSKEFSRSRLSVMSASRSGNRSAVKGMTFPGCPWPCTRNTLPNLKLIPTAQNLCLLDSGLYRRPAPTNRIPYWLANVFRRWPPFDQSCPAFWTRSCREIVRDRPDRKDERRRDLRDRQGRSSAATSRSECLNRRRRFNTFSDGRLRGRQPWTRRQGCPDPRSIMAPRVPNGSGVTPRTQSSTRSASS